jgi:anti-sigma regulatory factor (Ser/Thr protein kinase)
MPDRADTEGVFSARLPATPPSVALLREQLRGWLEQQHVSPAEIFDIVLASSESLTLVIEGTDRQVALVVDVAATLEDGDLELTTRDYGLWRKSCEHGREEPLGLALMCALMDTVELERHADGQRITLRKRVTVVDTRSRALLI